MAAFKKIGVGVAVVAFTLGLAGFVTAVTAVSLGTADDFAVLGGSGITIGGGS